MSSTLDHVPVRHLTSRHANSPYGPPAHSTVYPFVGYCVFFLNKLLSQKKNSLSLQYPQCPGFLCRLLSLTSAKVAPTPYFKLICLLPPRGKESNTRRSRVFSAWFKCLSHSPTSLGVLLRYLPTVPSGKVRFTPRSRDVPSAATRGDTTRATRGTRAHGYLE